MDWKARADRLAAEVTHPASRWRPLVAAMPRHVFVPRWWAWSQRGPLLWHDTWELRDGPADPPGWLDAAYSDKSLVTRVWPLHADHAGPADRPTGRPTSSQRLGERGVTSIDIDEYLTAIAAERLDSIGLRPRILNGDATGPGGWSPRSPGPP